MILGILFKRILLDKEMIIKEIEAVTKELQVTSYELQEMPPPSPPAHTSQGGQNETPNSELPPKIDFILCFGGDGTMLRSAENSIFYSAPVLGVNLGKLGFLTDISLKELKQSIQSLINKKYRLENRMLLDISVIRENKPIYQGIALNDAVIFKGSNSKLIRLRLYANRQFVYETRSDGIVVSTPTGSTAYSLSAGGPLISPIMQAIVVTALNPHILTVRPMVFDENETIEIKLPEKHHIFLQTDGNSRCELEYQDRIIIKKSQNALKFVKLTQKTFYQVLRKKLQMGKI